MLYPQANVYVGKQLEHGYTGSFAENNIFFLITIEDGMKEGSGVKLLEKMKGVLHKKPIQNLSQFDQVLSESIFKANVPIHASIAAGVLVDKVLYVKTIGKGQVYFRRDKDFGKLISGDKSASGYIQDADLAIFTTAQISALLGDENDIKSFVGHEASTALVTNLQSQQYGDEDQGFGALFVEFLSEKMQQEVVVSQGSVSEEPSVSQTSPMLSPTLGERQPSPLRKFQGVLSSLRLSSQPLSKKLTVLAVIVIFLILVWSVVFGYQRRVEAQLQKQIDTTKEHITKKLNDAEEGAFLNIENARSLLAEAKADLAKLKSEVGDKKSKELQQLDQLIKEKENTIMKREEKNFEEFYDLALEHKNAQGSRAYLDGEQVAILDNKNNFVYVLSLTKKSLVKKTSAELSSAQLVVLNKDDVYFLNSKGFFKFTSDDKVQRVIETDKEWGKIVDIELYNGNAYALDQENDEVYKYVATGSGFSPKTSYFQSGQAVDLANANSLAIDSAIYVGTRDTVYKYVKGAREEFKTSFPEESVKLNKVYTNADVEKVFVWDKEEGTVFVLSKSGAYERQITSEILRKGSDVFVFKDMIYVLAGQKIYTIGL